MPIFDRTPDTTGWKRFTDDFGAIAGNTAACDTAIANWKKYGASQGANLAQMVIPAGNYPISGGPGTANSITGGIQKAQISGYGATLTLAAGDRIVVGGGGKFNDDQHHALIASANAGATSVTVTDGHVARFAVGDWILIGGLAFQSISDPDNFHFFEYRKITGIVGNVVSFSEPLLDSYLSTWPLVPTNPGYIAGGPVAIYKYAPGFETDVSIVGLNFAADIIHTMGKDIFISDSVWNVGGPPRGMWPSQAENVTYWYCTLASGIIEVDKLVSNMTFDHFNGSFYYQSSSIRNFKLTNSVVGITQIGRNATIDKCQIDDLRVAPAEYGKNDALTVTNSQIGRTQLGGGNALVKGNVSYDGNTGTFSAPLGNGGAGTPSGEVFKHIIPGRHYFFGADGGNARLVPDSGAPVWFLVSALYQSNGNICFDTDLPSRHGTALPNPTFGGVPYGWYWPYNENVVLSDNTGAGAAHLADFAWSTEAPQPIPPELVPPDEGIAGPMGPQGPAGPQGPMGPQGPSGAQGLVGPQGPQGATGSGIPEAPKDGNTYARKNGAWVRIK